MRLFSVMLLNGITFLSNILERCLKVKNKEIKLSLSSGKISIIEILTIEINTVFYYSCSQLQNKFKSKILLLLVTIYIL